ncbi:hypothetical protein [Vampirovibrio chlorellavorus]|uniref:hypothetical protein n=1 Tax=Vampirovibrio chlorellavorus TaxID=758823 RepID=UPI0026E9A1AE|nr:hypothetical protein [Vampirovibrio chlorellavorus]
MSQPLFHSEQVAAEWASRICDRLDKVGVPREEIEETRNIIFAFTRIAADELSKDRTVKLPYTDNVVTVDATTAHQIIDLFLRGINHCAKKLRDSRLDWERRKAILETLAWKLFNLSKIMIGLLQYPPENLPMPLQDPKDLQLMMKQSADVLLREETTGIRGGALPLPWQP